MKKITLKNPLGEDFLKEIHIPEPNTEHEVKEEKIETPEVEELPQKSNSNDDWIMWVGLGLIVLLMIYQNINDRD